MSQGDSFPPGGIHLRTRYGVGEMAQPMSACRRKNVSSDVRVKSWLGLLASQSSQISSVQDPSSKKKHMQLYTYVHITTRTNYSGNNS